MTNCSSQAGNTHISVSRENIETCTLEISSLPGDLSPHRSHPGVFVSVKYLLLVFYNSPQTFRFFLRCSSISSDYFILFCNMPDSQKRDPKGNMLVTRGLPVCVPKRIWWNLPSLRALTNHHWIYIFNSKMSYLSSWEYYNQRQTALGGTVPAQYTTQHGIIRLDKCKNIIWI